MDAGWEADDRAHRLCDRFWPGALTLVLASPSGETQAFRAPDQPTMRVAIGSDHAGFNLKGDLCTLLDELRVEYRDFGTFDTAAGRLSGRHRPGRTRGRAR